MLSAYVEAFVVGALTPLTAACALPLYPGFLSYLARSDRTDAGSASGATASSTTATAADTGTDSDAGRSSFGLGVAVVAGVVALMGTVGLVFAYLLEASLTAVVEVVSPVAFAVLFVLGVALALDHDAVDRLPGLDPPETGSAYGSAFAYGLFFGGIVLPCNPGFIALFFARTPILFDSPLAGFAGFLTFGLGMGAPLLAFAAVSEARGRVVTRALARNASLVNRVTGVVMIAVSAYYLLVVFDVAGIGGSLGL
ncbi:cytochrome C biogenesis protein [Halorubellus sp. PRR65]|uniref:cytochrome C biogenesis protein n=1 Tax=Halorubellus sp. PRR65 TaxID=3098148 RepID=UPI002B2636CB|nr:cytochrome C biogenesis protein [Halorubellus sp. PRR65]